jgi:hypothetical protein
MTAKPIIETQGLVKRFGGVEVLSALSHRAEWRRKEHVLQMHHGPTEADSRSDQVQERNGYRSGRRLDCATRHGYQNSSAVAV